MQSSIWLLLAGCHAKDGIDFPRRLAPLEATNLASLPVGPDSAPTPERLSVVSGATDGLKWAHAKGYVHASVDDAWAAARDIEVCVDRREVVAYSVTRDTVPEFDYSYTIHNEVNDVITVEYDLTWVHEQQDGTEDHATLVVAQWDKTDGTTFIDLLAGSLVLVAINDELTEIQLIEHLEAPLRDEQTLVSYLNDYFDDLVATVHGRALPNFP